MEIKHKRRSTFSKLSAWVFKVVGNSFIGKFFKSYDKANNKFVKNSVKNAKNRYSPRRKRFERALENNFFARIIPRFYHFLLRIATRSYAAVFFIMGMIIFSLFFLNGKTLLIEINVDVISFITSIALILVSFPFLFSRKTLAGTVTSNKLISLIAFKLLGIYEDTCYEIEKGKRVNATTATIIFGVAFGITAYFIKPLLLLGLVLAFILAYVIFRTPEVGVIVVILTLPIANPFITKIVLGYVFLAYIVKAILRKRIYSFEFLDIWAIVFAVVFTIFGIDYQNILGSLPHVISNLSIFALYFVVSSLIRSQEWFDKCIGAFTVSGVFVALGGILQALLGIASANFEQMKMFEIYETMIPSTFGDNRVFAQFLVIVIPFGLVHMFTKKRQIPKIVGFLLSMTLILGITVANSKSAIFGILVGVMILLIMYNRNFIYLAISALAVLISSVFIVKENEQVKEAILSLGIFKTIDPVSKFDSILEGIKQIFTPRGFLGVGVGAAPNADQSFLVQLGLERGVLAVVVFALFAIMFARLVFSYQETTKNHPNRKVISGAGLCALIGLFSTGIFVNVWENEKIVLLSVLCVSLSFAYIKIEKERVHSSYYYKNELSRASLEIEVKEQVKHENKTARKYVHAPKKTKVGSMTSTNIYNTSEGPMFQTATGILIPVEDDDIEDDTRV